MDTDILRTFVALSKAKSFSRTADTLYVTQSTVTKRIGELEKELSVQLFKRDKRHVALTVEGEIFLSYAKRMLELEDASFKEIGAHIKFNHFLRVGATNSIYECYLPPLIANYLSPQKNNAVRITIDHSNDLLAMLQDGVLDVVFSYVPFHKMGYGCIPFQTDELVLVASSNNTSLQADITKSDLAKIDYLLCNFTLQDAGLFIRELFPAHHQFSFEIDNSTKLLPYLLEGIGCTFLPKKMVDPCVAKHELRVIRLSDLETPIIKSYCAFRLSDRQRIDEFLNLS